MFKTAELNLTFDSIPDADDLGAFIARATELGFIVTGAGASTQVSGRYAVTFTTGEDRDAEEVFKAYSKLMTVSEAIKG